VGVIVGLTGGTSTLVSRGLAGGTAGGLDGESFNPDEEAEGELGLIGSAFTMFVFFLKL